MAISGTLTFDDINTVAIESEENVKPCSLMDELEKGAKLYNERLQLRKFRNSKIKPLYEEAQKRRREMSKIAYYKYVYCPPRKYKYSCHHTGRIIFDRELLTDDEHISFLARPKRNVWRRHTHHPRAYFLRRFFPHCTTRIDFLANPKCQYVKGTWAYHAHHLNARQRACLTHYLVKSRIKHTTIENALTFIDEERKQVRRRKGLFSRKVHKLRRAIVRDRKKQAAKIVHAVYEVAKDFLMTESYETVEEIEGLSSVLFEQIMRFTSTDAPTEQFQNVLQTLSYNLAGWIVRIFETCGFTNLLKKDEDEEKDEPSCEHDVNDINFLPVEDYIPFSSSSILDDDESEEENGEEFEDLMENNL